MGRNGGQEKCGSETLEGSEQVCSVSGQSELQLKHLNPGQERPGECRGNWREPGEAGWRKEAICLHVEIRTYNEDCWVCPVESDVPICRATI